MKHFFRTLLGLLLVILVLAGCSSPVGPEIPEIPEDNTRLVKVEFVWGVNPQIFEVYDINNERGRKLFYYHLSRYLLCLRSNQNGNNQYEYPKGYEDKYKDFSGTSEEYFKKNCEDVFEEVFGTKYHQEGEEVNLEKWTSKAKDLKVTTDNVSSQLYFLIEDIGKADYDQDIYENYYDYICKNSFDKIEVKNENIKVYVYWKYQ